MNSPVRKTRRNGVQSNRHYSKRKQRFRDRFENWSRNRFSPQNSFGREGYGAPPGVHPDPRYHHGHPGSPNRRDINRFNPLDMNYADLGSHRNYGYSGQKRSGYHSPEAMVTGYGGWRPAATREGSIRSKNALNNLRDYYENMDIKEKMDPSGDLDTSLGGPSGRPSVQYRGQDGAPYVGLTHEAPPHTMPRPQRFGGRLYVQTPGGPSYNETNNKPRFPSILDTAPKFGSKYRNDPTQSHRQHKNLRSPQLILNDTIKNYKIVVKQLQEKMRDRYPRDLQQPPKCEGKKIGGSTLRSINWLKLQFRTLEDFEYGLNRYYEILECIGGLNPKSRKQIDADLHRTFAEIPFFRKGALGYHQLRNILSVMSLKRPEVGYVQGMNFIAACFLYHLDEPFAFWMFEKLINELEMTDIFEKGKTEFDLSFL